MKKIDLEKLINLVREKYIIDQNEWHAKEPWFYLWELESEIKEVKEELRENNSIYLEDELWDILRDYLNFLAKLEKSWYIDNIENVINHSSEKFHQRIDWKRNWILWNEVKGKQKEELKKRHNLKYNKKIWDKQLCEW